MIATNSMYALFDAFFEICLLRKGPQDLPASWPLLKLSLITYGLSSLLSLLSTVEPPLALFQAVLDAALLAGLTYGLLRVTGHRPRFLQTLTALAGTGTLLGLIAWPLTLWMQTEAAADTGTGLSFLLFFLLLLWSIAVIAHILRHALSTTLGMGLLYTLGYLMISVMVWELFYP